MPYLKNYGLFISHAWRYNDDYYRLLKLLDAAPYFSYRNYSVPEHDPVLDPDDEGDRKKLVKELDGQIRPVSIVLVISGMYAAYSYWIKKEIDISLAYGKPIVGLIPRGQERTPTVVSGAAKEMVGWTTDSIITAIRKWSL